MQFLPQDVRWLVPRPLYVANYPPVMASPFLMNGCYIGQQFESVSLPVRNFALGYILHHKITTLFNLLLVFLCLSLVPLFGQTSFGRISGSVIDPSGAAIAGAQVVVTNTETKQARTVTTDNAGFYVATNLPVGQYSVSVEQQGFKREEKSGFALVADGRVTADFHLQLGDVTQNVDVVTASAETLNTVSGELAHVIDTKQVDNLALNGRTYTQLMTLVPGANVTNPDQFSVTTSLSATGQTINGNRSDSNNLTVDGAFNLVAGSNGSLMNNVSPDFVQEVKVQTSNFSAEYGRTSGPAFNVVTKNGTNQFHGAAFEYLRNDALDARNFFVAKKPPLRFNDFGYDVGGPIKKDKLFFFVGEEWKRLRQTATPTRVTVPTSAELTGNFAGQPTIYFPGTKNPIPGNVIPSNLITPDGKAIGNVYRLMSQQGASFTDAAVSNNLTLTPSNPLNFREDIVRIDYHLNDQHSIYGRWIQDDNVLTDPFGTFSGSNLPTTPTIRMRPGESFLIAETWVPSANIVNEVRANASWASQNIPPTGNTWLRSTYGFQFAQLYNGGQYNNGIPDVGITGYANFKGPSFALHSPSTDIQVADTLSIIKGSHIIKFGGVFIRDRVDQNGRPSYTGNFSFNPSANPNTTQNALADALLGNYRTYNEASSDPMAFFRFSQPEAFVQDSWKASRKLSFEFGLRYQFMEPIYTQANNIANFNQYLYNPANAVTVNAAGRIVPGSGNPYNGLIAAGNGIPAGEKGRVPVPPSQLALVPTGAPRGLYPSRNTFAPRFGFAYSADEKTVLRGGFGMFYFRPEGNLIFSQANLPPFLQITQYENGNISNIAGGSVVAAPIGTISAIDPHLDNGYTEQFSFSVERQLPYSMLLETSYVGNLGRHLQRQPDLNQPDFSVLAAAPSGVAENALRPYQGFSAINDYVDDSTSNYHALQVYVSKRAGAATFTAGYTWSKALGDSSLSSGDENYYDRHYDYGPLASDRRHAFFSTFVLQLPALRNQERILRSVAGSWQLSGIIRLQTGENYNITADTAIGTRRADYVGGSVLVPSSQRNVNNWINKSAFVPAAKSHFGTSGPGIVEGPGLQTYDLSAAKYFPIKERFNLRLQADFFNAFNVANFSGLGTTVTSGGFGTLSSAYPGRNLQLGLKLIF